MIAPKCKLSVMYVTDLGKTGIIASNGFLDQLSYYNRLRLPKNRHKSKTRLVSVIVHGIDIWKDAMPLGF